MFCFAVAASAQSACLDQSYLPSPLTNGLEVTAAQPVTQTFTVGRSGLLTLVEIAQINHHRGTPSQPLQVEIVTTDSTGTPTTTVLASVVVPPSGVPASRGPLPIDLSAFTIPVQQGQVLGLRLSTAAVSGTQTYAWWGEAPGGSYAGGMVFIQQGIALSVWDLAFRTWVLVPASVTPYGVGHAGSQGVPLLGMSAMPLLGTTPQVLLGNAAGVPTFAALLFGVSRASQPTPFGGTALVVPIASASVPLPVGGAQVPFAIPNDPVFCGQVVDIQGVHLDAGASAGVAFSPGLELVVGG